MINAEQIRAARALLDWSTADLAKQTNMTVNGINKIERGHVQAHRETIETLESVFESAGIEFLPRSGLRKKDRMVHVLEGEDANRKLLDDVYNTLRDIGGEVLIVGLDENLVIKDVDKKFLEEHLVRLEKNNIGERLLVKTGDTNFIASAEIYRWMPEKYFSPYPLYIYGSKLALVSWAPTPRCIIIHDEAFAESTRRLFNYVWDLSEIPKKPKTVKAT
jgi:transcriptional regulator with XRE-family HTH domain